MAMTDIAPTMTVEELPKRDPTLEVMQRRQREANESLTKIHADMRSYFNEHKRRVDEFCNKLKAQTEEQGRLIG